MSKDDSALFWRAEALRLQLALDKALDRQVPLPLELPASPKATRSVDKRARHARMTESELSTLYLVYGDLLDAPQFARVAPADHDPLPEREEDVDAFIARRTQWWRARQAARLYRICMRHDMRERVLGAFTGTLDRVGPDAGDDDDEG